MNLAMEVTDITIINSILMEKEEEDWIERILEPNAIERINDIYDQAIHDLNNILK